MKNQMNLVTILCLLTVLGACGQQLSAKPGTMGQADGAADEPLDSLDGEQEVVRGLTASNGYPKYQVTRSAMAFVSKGSLSKVNANCADGACYVKQLSGGSVYYQVKIAQNNHWQRMCHLIANQMMEPNTTRGLRMEAYFDSVMGGPKYFNGIAQNPTCLAFSERYDHGFGNRELSPRYRSDSPARVENYGLNKIDLAFAQPGWNRIIIQDHSDLKRPVKFIIGDVSSHVTNARNCLEKAAAAAGANRGLVIRGINAGVEESRDGDRILTVIRLKASNMSYCQ